MLQMLAAGYITLPVVAWDLVKQPSSDSQGLLHDTGYGSLRLPEQLCVSAQIGESCHTAVKEKHKVRMKHYRILVHLKDTENMKTLGIIFLHLQNLLVNDEDDEVYGIKSLAISFLLHISIL